MGTEARELSAADASDGQPVGGRTSSRSGSRGRSRPRIVIARDNDQIVLKVSGALTRELGDQLVDAVDAAAAIAPDVALDLRDVGEWTAEGLESLDRCADRGIRLERS
jgi:hypothetical protein